MSELPRFIVGELSKNWVGGYEHSPTGFLCEQFERMVNVNHERGYRLLHFQFHRLMTGPDDMNETLIAVFERTT